MQIRKFLKEQIKQKKGLGSLLNSLSLNFLDSERFQEKFGEMTPEEMAEFIWNGNNSYEIGKWSERERNPGKRTRTNIVISREGEDRL